MPVVLSFRSTSLGPGGRRVSYDARATVRFQCREASEKDEGFIPGSGTGTICTSTWKLGPSLTTTPALHSLGMSK